MFSNMLSHPFWRRGLPIYLSLTFLALLLLDTSERLYTFASVSKPTSSVSESTSGLGEVSINSTRLRTDRPTATLASHPEQGGRRLASIMVFSARSNFGQRTAIRSTWANGVHGVTFFVGANACILPESSRENHLSCKWKVGVQKAGMRDDEDKVREVAAEQRLLEEEQRTNNDLVLLPMVDTYDKLSTKLKLALKWMVANTNSSWIFKIDDDNYVRIAKLSSIAKACGMTQSVIGSANAKVPVRQQGRFADTVYKARYYPTYPNGGVGYGITRDLAEYIVSRDFPVYPNEDTCIGIWLKGYEGVNYCWRNGEFHQDKRTAGRTCLHPSKAIVGHKFNALELTSCYRRDQEK